MKSTTSVRIVEEMKKVFSRFGAPNSLRIGNGLQFVSHEFEAFLEEYGVEHRKTTPFWPHANGEAGRQNRSPLKAMRQHKLRETTGAMSCISS